jgi:predicted RecB family nuclease
LGEAEKMTPLPKQFQFSQSNLQDYVDCARRFELRYLLQLKYPAPEAEPLEAHEYHMRLGEQFHRLIHQHLSGVPAEKLTPEDDQLKHWWNNYLGYGLQDVPTAYYPEETLVANLGGYRLVAKYDLIGVVPGEKLVIVDWKTAKNRPKRERLLKRLQTIVYRYILVEAGVHLNRGFQVQPEQIEMRYWFAEHPQKPEVFPYSTAGYEQDKVYLTGLMREIEARTNFELTQDVSKCKFCTYRALCRRGVSAGDMADLESEADDVGIIDFNFDQIAEVEF